jgi:UDP-glucose 4-epimerase
VTRRRPGHRRRQRAAVPELARDLGGVELRESQLRTVSCSAVQHRRRHAVAHLAVATSPDRSAAGRAAMKESNVIGTMQLLAACQQAPRLRKLVVRSSTAAYGASFRDPAVFTEDTEPRDVPRGGFAATCSTSRATCAASAGGGPTSRDGAALRAVHRPAAETRLSRYFSMPVVPTVLGRDPRLQFVPRRRRARGAAPGDRRGSPGHVQRRRPGVLTLYQAIRRAGRVAAPILEPGCPGWPRSRSGPAVDFSSTSSTCSCTAGWSTPMRSCASSVRAAHRAEAFDEFVRAQTAGPVRPARLRERREADPRADPPGPRGRWRSGDD